MARLNLKLEGSVAVITMDENDNRLNPDMCTSFLDMLDRIERETDASTLVVKSGHGWIWSYGFDIDWIDDRIASGDKGIVTKFLLMGIELRKRLLTYPMITIAAINGHVYGGGAVLACCFDYRFMRSDRGFFCIPAIDRNFPVNPGAVALLRKTLPAYLVDEAVLTGRRYTGKECAEHGIVAASYHNDELMERVMSFAGSLNKRREIVGEMKRVRNAHIISLMEGEDRRYIEQGEVRV